MRTIMVQLTVRGVDNEIVLALKARAARAGRSAEAEHRRILEEALRPVDKREFFEAAYRRRIKLPFGVPDTTELLRRDRNRDEA